MTARSNDTFGSKEFKDWNEANKTSARRARNLDRAIVIVARLMFEGCILMDTNSMYGDVFENSVTAVLDLLERFHLDSPEGEIIDVFGGAR